MRNSVHLTETVHKVWLAFGFQWSRIAVKRADISTTQRRDKYQTSQTLKENIFVVLSWWWNKVYASNEKAEKSDFFSLNPLNRLLEVFCAELNFLAGIIFSQLNGLDFILKPPIRSLCKMIYLLISNAESILPKSLKMEISVINLSMLHERHHKKRPTLAKDLLFRAANIFLVVLIHLLNLTHTHTHTQIPNASYWCWKRKLKNHRFHLIDNMKFSICSG